MNHFAAFVTARRDEYIERIGRLERHIPLLPPESLMAATERRLLAVNRDLLAVVERHAEERTDG